MGLDKNGIKFLLRCFDSGVQFGKTICLGHQKISVAKEELMILLKASSVTLDEELIDKIYNEDKKYADKFFYLLGAEHVDSMDFSDYEGASVIHDLNSNINMELHKRYNVVFDGGTLEHIFNFPVAIENCMKMLAIGGNFIGISPTNNFMGHGFYQFSPELYFSLFRKNNFEIVFVNLFIDRNNTLFYELKDPAVVESRIEMVNSWPAYLGILASKIDEVEKIEYPNQSDYEMMSWESKIWDISPSSKEVVVFKVSGLMKKIVPTWIKGVVRMVYWNFYLFYQDLRKKFYPTGTLSQKFYNKK